MICLQSLVIFLISTVFSLRLLITTFTLQLMIHFTLTFYTFIKFILYMKLVLFVCFLCCCFIPGFPVYFCAVCFPSNFVHNEYNDYSDEYSHRIFANTLPSRLIITSCRLRATDNVTTSTLTCSDTLIPSFRHQ